MDRNALNAQLNGETARIAWSALERHFARGAVVTVAPGEDLVGVAADMAQDDSDRVDALIHDGKMAPTDSVDAARWSADNRVLWAVVVAPWVLVQEAD